MRKTRLRIVQKLVIAPFLDENKGV